MTALMFSHARLPLIFRFKGQAASPIIARPEDSDVAAVWNAIATEKVVHNGSLLTLSDGTEWQPTVHKLYKRRCYDCIINRTNSVPPKGCVLVKGTPGVGKSLFALLYLAHLVESAKRRGAVIPSIHFIHRIDLTMQKLHLLPDGSVHDITDIMVKRPDYLLIDNVDVPKPNGVVLSMLVTSDRPIRYNDYKKAAERSGLTITMPPCSLEELQSMKPDGISEKDVSIRYSVFGGSARSVIGQTGEIDLAPSTYAVDFLQWYFAMNSTEFSANETMTKISKKLSLPIDSEPELSFVTKSMFIHRTADGGSEFASTFMREFARWILDAENMSVTDQLKSIIRAAGIGNLFESTGHRKMTMQELPFTLKPLIKTVSKKKSAPFPKAQFNLPIYQLYSISDIAHLPDKTYGLPVHDSFPVADAIIQPDTLLQFNVAPNQHNTAVGKLLEMKKLLHCVEGHRIIYVIPKKNIETFRFHSALEEAGFQQFVTIEDPCSDEVLMTEKERSTWGVKDKRGGGELPKMVKYARTNEIENGKGIS